MWLDIINSLHQGDRRKIIRLVQNGLSAVLLLAFARPAETQIVISAKDFPDAIRTLDNAPTKNSLGCNIQIPKKPNLDYAFRYITTFSIDCNFGVVQPGMKVVAFIRVTPERGPPVLMTEEFDLSQMSRDKRLLPATMDQLLLAMSGGFATGSGRYSVEVVLTDQLGQTCRKHKKLKTAKAKYEAYDLPALPPDAVEPLMEAHWNGKLATDGLRLTILLRVEGSGLAKGQNYILESLAELLAALPCRSVKLIAFNLDRQQEIFRQDSLDSGGFVKLKESGVETCHW